MDYGPIVARQEGARENKLRQKTMNACNEENYIVQNCCQKAAQSYLKIHQSLENVNDSKIKLKCEAHLDNKVPRLPSELCNLPDLCFATAPSLHKT
jgi:hypothetical protein